MQPFHNSASVYDVIYQNMLDYPDLAAKLVAVLEESTPQVADVLEVGCGTGLYLEQLARRYSVTGLDLSAPMLEIAAARCPEATLVEGDMTDFDLGREFDAVVCVFSSIGYVVTEEAMRAAIAAMARHVRRGGVVVVEPWLRPEVATDRYHNAAVFQGDDTTVARLVYTRIDDGKTLMDMHHVVATGAGVESFVERHVMGLFTVDQHLEAFEAAGLDVTYHPEGLIGRGLYVGVRK